MLRCVVAALGDLSVPLTSERELVAHADDGRVMVIDDLDRLPSTAARTAAARISRGGATVVALSAGAVVPVALDRALKAADGLLVRLGPMAPDALDEFLRSIGHPVSTKQLSTLHERSGGIAALAVALTIGSVNGDGSGRYRTDLSTLAAGLRSELSSAARRLFDLLCVTGGIPHNIAKHLEPVGAHRQLERMGLVISIDRDGEADMQIAAPALVAIVGSMVGHADRRHMLELTLERCRQFDPPSPGLAHRIRRGRWSLAVDGDLDVARDGLEAAMLSGDLESVIEFGRQIVRRNPGDCVSARRLTVALQLAAALQGVGRSPTSAA